MVGFTSKACARKDSVLLFTGSACSADRLGREVSGRELTTCGSWAALVEALRPERGPSAVSDVTFGETCAGAGGKLGGIETTVPSAPDTTPRSPAATSARAMSGPGMSGRARTCATASPFGSGAGISPHPSRRFPGVWSVSRVVWSASGVDARSRS
jgi:hypothetical protein